MADREETKRARASVDDSRMKRNNSIRSIIRHFASIALLVCLLFQLGACPCGCLEHNAWLEMLGIQHHEQPSDGQLSTIPSVKKVDVDHDHIGRIAAVEYDHECDGNGCPKYFNNARGVTLSQSCVWEVAPIPAILGSSWTSETTSRFFLSVSRFSGHRCAPSRSDLQVFRI